MRTDPAAAVVLQRSGQRPLRLTGWPVQQQGWSFDGVTAGIALALYVEESGSLAVAMHCAPPPDAGALPWHAAMHVADLEAAIGVLESARPDCAPAAATGASTIGVLHSAAHRLCLDHALRAAFAQAVGEFLFDLCATETSRQRLPCEWK